MSNIWSQLAQPIMCLAPMEEVTDTVFRQLLCKIGSRPDLMFSEFINVRHIYSHARISSLQSLEYTNQEKPLILQLWGNEPELYYQAADLAYHLGYDGIDINMGCPQPKITKQQACSALIKNRPLASEIIQATKAGAAGRLPVSVKTRIGFDQVITHDWIGFLLEHDLDALTIHGRTSAQLSKVPANWQEIAEAVKLRNQMKKSTLIIGNGDVTSFPQAHSRVAETGVNGVMIGRGIFYDPWLFAPNREHLQISKQLRLQTLLDHVQIWEETWGENRHYEQLKRFYKIYCQDFANASDLRVKLMATKNVSEVRAVIAETMV